MSDYKGEVSASGVILGALMGQAGPKGDKGATGERGPQGEKGEKGDKGDKGATGPQGPQGEKGDKGDKGPQGEQGIQGEQGPVYDDTEIQEKIRNLDKILTRNEISGEYIYIKDSAEYPAEIVVNGNTRQEVREGYNLLNTNLKYKVGDTLTISGITLTFLENGKIKLNGIAEKDDIDFYIYGTWASSVVQQAFPIGNYTVKIGGADIKTSIIYMGHNTTPKIQLGYQIATTGTANFTEVFNCTYFIFRVKKARTTYNNDIYEIQITKTEDKDKPYEAYGKAPTPNFPSEVKTVTGNVGVKVENKNYIDITDLPNWSISMASGYRGKEFNLKPSTNYTISQLVDRISSTTGNKISYIFAISGKYAGGSFSSGIDGALVGKPITVKTDTNGVLTIFISNIEIKKEYGLMLEEGTKATEYVEHQSQDYTLDLTQNFANNHNKTIENCNISGTGTLSEETGFSMLFFKVLKGSYKIRYKDSKSVTWVLSQSATIPTYGDVITARTVKTATEVDYEITQDGYLAIRYAVDSGHTIEEFIKNLLITSDVGYNIELCKIGDYADYIYRNGSKWFKRNNINIVNAYDICKNTSYYEFNSTYKQHVFNNVINNLKEASLYTNTNKKLNMLSNCFIAQNFNDALVIDKNNLSFLYVNTSTNQLRFKYGDVTTKEEFLNLLNEKNVKLYYPLATPTDTEITDTTLIAQLNALENAQLYEGITIIIVITSDGINPILGLKYVESPKLVKENLQAQIDELKSAIVSLGTV